MTGSLRDEDHWPCDWIVDRGYTEDGDKDLRECGADSSPTYGPDGQECGWSCAAGHSHVYAEVRYADGWDYASDAEEAYHLRRNLVDAVGPDGCSI